MSAGGRSGICRALARAFALACLVSVAAHAQDGVGLREIRFRTWSTAEGLSQATVRTIAQDRDGFIWIGTQDGLDRFDGYGFTTYRHDRNDPYTLTQNHVWALAADPD